MVKNRFRAMFPTQDKPLIAIAHLPALPGTPPNEAGAGLKGIVDPYTWNSVDAGRADRFVLAARR